ncbi:MAG TPA: TolC family protein [Fulvivirga sp.]|nr:TolC family protein [Fulvivirga sp.]
MKYIKVLIFTLLCSGVVMAQEVKQWTLQECIDYALENNLSVKRSALNVQSSDIDLKQAQFSRLPNLNANGSYSNSWGRSIDPTTNLFVDNQKIASSNASINSGVTLFNGLSIQNNIKQNKFGLKASEETLEDTKNTVIFNVINFYANVMFANELYENAKKQLESTEQQVLITEKRVKAGALPNASLLDLLAQKATNELNLINRENDYINSKISLKQALQLPPASGIEIVVPELDSDITPVLDVTAIEIYNIALNNQPNIKAARYNTTSAEYGIKAQRGNLFPTLSLNGGMSTQYSDAADRQRFVPDGGVPQIIQNPQIGFVQGTNVPVLSIDDIEIPSGTLVDNYTFGDQYSDNLRKFISLSLNIPIFNGFSSRNNLQRAVIAKDQAAITEAETKYQLWQTIEQAYNNVQAAAKSYNASLKQVEAREESFRVTQQRYELGAVNFTDYQIAENDLFQAKSDLLRAKYDYILKLKVLDFYQGKPLDF